MSHMDVGRGQRHSVLRAAFADVFKVAETSGVLVWSTSARTLMSRRSRDAQGCIGLHGGKSPKAETISIRSQGRKSSRLTPSLSIFKSIFICTPYAAGTHPGLLVIVFVVVCFLLPFLNARFTSWLPVLGWNVYPLTSGEESKVGVKVWVRPEIAVSIVVVWSKPSLLEHTDVVVMLFTARHWPLYIGH